MLRLPLFCVVQVTSSKVNGAYARRSKNHLDHPHSFEVIRYFSAVVTSCFTSTGTRILNHPRLSGVIHNNMPERAATVRE